MSKVTQEEFVQALGQIMAEQSAEELLAVPGVYEIFAEHFNNEALSLAESSKGQKDGSMRL